MTFSVEGFFLGYLLVSIGTFYFIQALLSLSALFERRQHEHPQDLMYRIPIVMGGGGPAPMSQQPMPPLSAQAGAEPGQYL